MSLVLTSQLFYGVGITSLQTLPQCFCKHTAFSDEEDFDKKIVSVKVIKKLELTHESPNKMEDKK